MKYKNVYITLLVVFFTSVNALAQYTIFAPAAGSNQFTGAVLNSDASTTTLPWATKDGARIIVWTEFGDGTYSRASNPIHFFGPDLTGVTVVSKATGIYTQPPPPPPPNTHALLLSTVPAGTGTSDDEVLFSSTGTTAQVELIPNVTDIVGGDEMHFAVNYRIPGKKIQPGAEPKEKGDISYWKIIVGYNDSKEETEVFKPLTTNESFSKYLDFNTTEYFPTMGGATEPFTTREHHGETADFNKDSYSYLPNATNKKHFIEWENVVTGDEKTSLFFTLLPNDKQSDGATTSINVWLVAYDASGTAIDVITLDPNNADVVTFMTNSKGAPHDPNYETVSPRCNLLTVKPTKVLPYHVHFQNTGTGAADSVVVTTYLPQGINISSGVANANFNASLRWEIGGEASTSTAPKYNLTVGIITGITPQRAVFTFKRNLLTDLVLSSFDEKKGLSDVKTMGDIYFDLPSNTTCPNVLNSHSSIVFFHYESLPMGNVAIAQPDILTNTAVTEFKACCNCVEPCKRKRCNPAKKRSRLWLWLFCKECK